MTTVYFVRHAQPVHSHKEDKTRPLTVEGLEDCEKVKEFFNKINIDKVFSSPYERTMSTVKPTAQSRGLEIQTDIRLRERETGEGGNVSEFFKKRWADFNFHEDGGESLGAVQKRNIEVLKEILTENPGKTIIIGTHGTAMSTIINYYYPKYNIDNFWEIINMTPCIFKLEFDGQNYLSHERVFSVEKEYRP